MRAVIIYAVLLIAATYKIASMPDYSLDSYLYSYLVSNDVQAFKSTPGLPAPYVHISDENYVQQRPFYSVKFLFVILASLTAKVAGVLRAPMVVSAVAYFLLGWVVWLWLGSANLKEPWRSVSGGLLMFSSVTTDTARMGTPDMLCTLLLVLGVWLLLETKYVVAGGMALSLSVLTRIDCAILAGVILMLGFWQKKVSPWLTATFVIVIVAIYLVNSSIGYSYPVLLAWTIRTSYFNALLHNLVKTELAIYCPFALLALIAVRKRYQRVLLAACGVSLVLRYVVMPHFEIRYLLPQAVIVGILGIASVLQETSSNEESSPQVISQIA